MDSQTASSSHSESQNHSKPSFFSKIRPPLTNFSKKKQAVAAVLTLVLVFAVGIGVYLSQQPTQLQPRADFNQGGSNMATNSGEINQPSQVRIDR